MKTSVSVIIPNYNYGRFLPEAIESIRNQTYRCDEIIVVDDGSTDDSLEVLAHYEKVGVIVLRQQNRGVGAARNTGVRHSNGEVVAFLDADDMWLPTKIERQVQRLSLDADIAFISCGMREFDSSGTTVGEFDHYLNGWCSEEFAVFRHPVVSGSAVVVPRKVFEAVGGFDERPELHPLEDMEFGYRVSRIGKVASVPELLVDYRNHGGNGHLNIERMERAMTLVYEKIYRQQNVDMWHLRHLAQGNLHLTLAGCHFQAGNRGAFLRHTAQALWHNPQNFGRYLTFPQRVWQRHFAKKGNV